jgi:hypothetical protein
LPESGKILQGKVKRKGKGVAFGAHLQTRDTSSFAGATADKRPRVKKVGVMGRFDADVQRLPPPGRARWAADVVSAKLGDAPQGKEKVQNLVFGGKIVLGEDEGKEVLR